MPGLPVVSASADPLLAPRRRGFRPNQGAARDGGGGRMRVSLPCRILQQAPGAAQRGAEFDLVALSSLSGIDSVPSMKIRHRHAEH